VLKYITHKNVEVLDCTPSQLKVLMEEQGWDQAADKLKKVLIGGEAIEAALWEKAGRAVATSFYNVYGPTETTVDASNSQIGAGPEPNIGKPIANVRMYILDPKMRVVPVGVSGELFIGGSGLARGYLRRAALTAEKFVPNPFSTQPGQR